MSSLIFLLCDEVCKWLNGFSLFSTLPPQTTTLTVHQSANMNSKSGRKNNVLHGNCISPTTVSHSDSTEKVKYLQIIYTYSHLLGWFHNLSCNEHPSSFHISLFFNPLVSLYVHGPTSMCEKKNPFWTDIRLAYKCKENKKKCNITTWAGGAVARH